MSGKYKYTILILVGLAVLAIIGFSNLTWFSNGEDQERGLADDQSRAAENPYSVYKNALADGKPVVIEFYARY